MTDIEYMQQALQLAKEAAERDEVPVGAIIVQDGQIIARGQNDREHSKCATKHAEIIAIENACRVLGGWRLPRCTLYVTMEPCAMCGGAIINARIDRVVYGTRDLRFGAYGSLFDLCALPFNHRPTVEGGVLEEECRALLQGYFQQKRKKN